MNNAETNNKNDTKTKIVRNEYFITIVDDFWNRGFRSVFYKINKKGE